MTIDERLQAQIRYAVDNAPATRERFERAGVSATSTGSGQAETIQTVADLQKLPIMPKDDVIKLQQANPPFGGLLGVPVSQISHFFFSPGPLYEPEMEGDDDTQSRMAQLALNKSGFGPGDVVLNTLSYHLVPAGLMLDHALTQIGCTVVPGGVGNSDLQLKMMGDLGVTGYVGTPSFLMSLIKKAEGMGLDFRNTFQLRKAFVTAEPLPASLRAQFVDDYGISVGNAYATAELGFLALNTDGSMAMQLLPEPIIELVDPETGQWVEAGAVGEVVVTNFSRAYPLIRFGTGDMAVNVDLNPGQSKQGERAIILVGRRGEAVKVRGMFVHPNQLRFAAGQVTQFTAIQGVVTRPDTRDHFVVRIVGADPATAPLVGQAIQQACRVRVDAVEFVEAIDTDQPAMLDARSWD